MTTHFRFIITAIITFTLAQPIHAEIITTKENFSGSGAEFFVGREYGRPLVQVSLLSGVNRPGVYHVPVQTQLPQLIAFAGGTVNNAEVDNIRVRRVEGGKTIVVNYDLDKLMKNTEAMPILQDKDTIHIPQSTALDTSVRWIAVLAGIASIALSVSIINQNSKGSSR